MYNTIFFKFFSKRSTKNAICKPFILSPKKLPWKRGKVIIHYLEPENVLLCNGSRQKDILYHFMLKHSEDVGSKITLAKSMG